MQPQIQWTTEQITSAFNNNVSFKKIREVVPETSSNNFDFTKVAEEGVKNGVLKLDTKKSSTSGSVPPTVLKESVETYLLFWHKQEMWLSLIVNFLINSKNQRQSPWELPFHFIKCQCVIVSRRSCQLLHSVKRKFYQISRRYHRWKLIMEKSYWSRRK